MNEFYHKFYTQHLSRDFYLLVFGTAGIPVIIFPTSKGRYFEAKDNGLIDYLSELIDKEKIMVFCPDSITDESWQNYDIHPADRIKTHIAYERVIVNDVIGFAKYESEKNKVVLVGKSLGGYYAVNTALKYPESIRSVIGINCLLNIKKFIMGFYDDNAYFNNPLDYFENLEDEILLEKIRKFNISLNVNYDSENKSDNKYLAEVFEKKKLNILYDEHENSVDEKEIINKLLRGIKDY